MHCELGTRKTPVFLNPLKNLKGLTQFRPSQGPLVTGTGVERADFRYDPKPGRPSPRRNGPACRCSQPLRTRAPGGGSGPPQGWGARGGGRRYNGVFPARGAGAGRAPEPGPPSALPSRAGARPAPRAGWRAPAGSAGRGWTPRAPDGFGGRRFGVGPFGVAGWRRR